MALLSDDSNLSELSSTQSELCREGQMFAWIYGFRLIMRIPVTYMLFYTVALSTIWNSIYICRSDYNSATQSCNDHWQKEPVVILNVWKSNLNFHRASQLLPTGHRDRGSWRLRRSSHTAWLVSEAASDISPLNKRVSLVGIIIIWPCLYFVLGFWPSNYTLLCSFLLKCPLSYKSVKFATSTIFFIFWHKLI